MVVTEIICCEAKLDDWRRGLVQAYGHRFYADRTFLAVANKIPRSIDYNLLRELKVGLLSVTDVVSEECPSVERQPEVTRARRQIEERFWTETILPRLRPGTHVLTSEEYGATA